MKQLKDKSLHVISQGYYYLNADFYLQYVVIFVYPPWAGLLFKLH